MMMHPNDMGNNDTNNNTNFQLARLAEAYLLFAEACLNTGKASEGLVYLNRIQERSGSGKISGSLTLQDIQDEKEYEMWFEGTRFHDIVRWGIAKECFDKVTDNIPYCYDDFFIEGTAYYQKEHHLRAVTKHPLAEAGITNRFEVGKHEHWPIPADILDLNVEMHQTGGWAK